MMKPRVNVSVNSLEDLHAEMRVVKQRIKDREQELASRWNRLPGEIVKGSISAVLPALIGNQVASGVWTLLKGIYSLLKTNPPGENAGGDWKNTIAGGAKQLGLSAIIKLIFGLIKGK